MESYLGLYFLLCIATFLSHGKGERIKKTLFFVCCTVLIVITGFRNQAVETWPDTENYLNYFWLFKRLNWHEALRINWEPGFIIVSKLLGSFINNNQFYLFVLGLLVLIPIFVYFWRESSFPILSLTIYLASGLFWNSSIYRQMFALAILLFSVRYIKQRKLIKFLLLLFIAVLFHRTAIVFILAYVVYGKKITNQNIIYAISISFLLGVFGDRIFNLVSKFARIPYFATSGGGGIWLLIVLWASIFISCLLINREEMDDNFQFVLNLTVLAAIIQSLTLSFSLFSRVVQYFIPFQCILLTNVVVHLQNKNEKYFLIEPIMEVALIVWLLAANLQPYAFYWQTL